MCDTAYQRTDADFFFFQKQELNERKKKVQAVNNKSTKNRGSIEQLGFYFPEKENN